MARDYKHRATSNKKKPQQSAVAWWKWVLIFLLIALFVLFLGSLSDSTPEIESPKKQASISNISVPTKTKAKIIPKHQNNKPAKPVYEFYTILPKTEVVVPDYEIKTRSREEKIGKRKPGYYVIQAGSFRDFIEADKLRATLALMGIESKVEKATVGNVVWNRVKIGPYSHSSKVSVMKKRLKKQGIDTIVIEEKG